MRPSVFGGGHFPFVGGRRFRVGSMLSEREEH